MPTPRSDRPQPRPRPRTAPPAARRVPRKGARPVRAGGTASSARAGKPGRRRHPALRILGLLVALLVVAGGVAGCVAYDRISASLPDPTKPLNGTDLSTRILDRNGKLITTLYADQNRQYVTLAQIPKVLQDAVISTEDQRFYEHAGVDPVGMLRALWVDILAGSDVQGGSTITQQYAKQAFVGSERTLSRKIAEALLAYRLEQYYTKDKILEMYLNTIYFGHGAYGVQTAAQTYFGTPVQDLTVAQAAMIAGVIKSPGLYSPYIDPTAAKDRRDTVLGQMHTQGYIDDATYAAAVASPIKTVGLKPPSAIAPYFVDYLKQDLVDRFGEQAVYRGGLTVTTTLDLTMQAAAEKAVASNLNRAGDPSAALVAIDPATGEIRAMVGGRDYSTQQFNVATQGHRQPGSSFKPFVLVTALQDGISPEATFTAQSTTLRIPGGQTWRVAGEAGYSGPMRLRIAMMHSINPVFAQLILKVGADRVVQTADAMGITTKITPVPAVALGGMAEGVTPLEMASAYGTLADGGVHATPIDVLKVTDKDGNVVYSATPVTKQVIDPAIAYLTTDILKGVITGGTGTAANIGRPAAGKTGTTQRNSDAWFVGYTPDLVASVWVGYAGSTRPMTSVHGIAVYGGSFPAHIWATFMKAALKGTPATQFTRPPGLVSARICLVSGLLATASTTKTGPALFLAGHLPGPCPMRASQSGPKMPELVGMAKADALAALDALAIRYSVVESAVNGVAAGVVAAQTPAAGSVVASGTVVTVTVSTGGSGTYTPPTAAFSWTVTGSTVKFDASASTAEGAIVSWQWQYDASGTKDTASGKTASHTYTTAGAHQVTLWVKDDKGTTVSITRLVKIPSTRDATSRPCGSGPTWTARRSR